MVVLDSSSLILLAKAGLLDITINSLKEKPLIPWAVYAESVGKKKAEDATLIEARVKQQKITVQVLEDLAVPTKLIQDFNLGQGEAEAIALCLANKMVLVTDDKKAMNTCRLMEINFITVPNIVVELYREKRITKIEAEIVIQKLNYYGRYSEKIIEQMQEGLP